MYQTIQFKTKILSTLNSINRSPLRYGFLFITLACFALAPQVQAACQDACLTNGNTVHGDDALISLTTGAGNTASGFNALQNDTTGTGNTASGFNALQNNTTGFNNTAVGTSTLQSSTTGNANTAGGVAALANNTTGGGNTACGYGALFDNTTGIGNIALGESAGAFTTGSRNIDIGNTGVAGEGQTIRIGTQGTQTKTFIAGVSNAGVNGSAVKVNAAGQIGAAPSAARFKNEIRPMDNASETILALKPVTFRYKKDVDPEGSLQFGLVAEDVAKVNPDLVIRDAEGKFYSVRYDAVNAMLLNEFLKEHKTVQELKSAAAKQEAKIAGQQKQIAALAAGLQKVSAQLEVSKSSPQTVLNNQ